MSYLSARLHIPGELLAGISIVAGLVGIGFALRSLRRRPDRVAISRSWASQRLARLESLGATRGRPRAPNETTPNYVRALGAIAPGQDEALDRVGAAIDAAMFAPEPPNRSELDEIDALLRTIESGWSDATNPGDLVPSH